MSGDTALQQLYHDVILDHHKRPRNCRALDGARTAEGHNPLCGDRLVVYVRLAGETIADVAFQGRACAIAVASASLMTERIRGHTIADADALVERVDAMLAAPPGRAVEDLGPVTALAGVRQFPTRVKCARLAWRAVQAALHASHASVSTEPRA